MQYFSKALITSAFVVFSIWIVSGYTLGSDCPLPADPQSVDIRRVYDGDTLLLNDGRKVRLIGINTPELGRSGQPDQPLAIQATAAARRLLKGQNPVRLQLGSQSKDHYGRVLGHIFLANDRNLEAELLKQGLGFAISIPPNLSLRDCLNQAERGARQAKLGVWDEPYYQPIPASSLNRHSGGFGRYRGTISRAGTNTKGRYLELSGKIFVPIETGTATALDSISSDNLLGLQLEIRGWLIARTRSKAQKNRGFLPFMLKINHMDDLRLCDPNC